MFGVTHSARLAPLEKASWRVESHGHLLQASASNRHWVFSSRPVSYQLQPLIEIYYLYVKDDYESTDYE